MTRNPFFLVGLVVALVLLLAGSYFVYQNKFLAPISTEPVACTKDARVCPDGSVVGRVPPDCQFAACPADQ